MPAIDRPTEVTRLLDALSGGSREALDQLVPLLYEELHRIAHRELSKESEGHTLSTTALVHEAYLKLVGLDRIHWKSRAQFLALASQAMRRVLVDHAVRRKAQKRGGGRSPLPLDEAVGIPADRFEDLLALDDALRRLESIDARGARVVECRFFGGMTIEETAEALELSPATVKRDWTTTRAWLNRELEEAGS